MKKLFLLPLLAIGFISCEKDEIDALNTVVDANTAAIELNAAAIDALAKNLDAYKVQTDAAISNLGDALVAETIARQEADTALQALVDALRTDVDSNTTNIATLAGDLTTLTGVVFDNYNELSGLIADNVTLINTIKVALEDAIAAEATAREAGDDTLANTLSTSINSLQGALNTVASDLSGVAADLGTVSSTVDANSDDIDTNLGDISDINTVLVSLSTILSEIDSQNIAQINAMITELQAQQAAATNVQVQWALERTIRALKCMLDNQANVDCDGYVAPTPTITQTNASITSAVPFTGNASFFKTSNEVYLNGTLTFDLTVEIISALGNQRFTIEYEDANGNTVTAPFVSGVTFGKGFKHFREYTIANLDVNNVRFVNIYGEYVDGPNQGQKLAIQIDLTTL